MARLKRGAVDTSAADDVLESMLSREEQLLAWIGEQRQAAVLLLIAALVAAGALGGGWLWMQRQSGRAGAKLNEALNDYHGKVQAEAGKPGEKVFKTDDERLAAAAAALDSVIADYPTSESAAQARLLKVSLLTEQGKTDEAYALAARLSVSGNADIAGPALQAQAELAPFTALPPKERDAIVKSALEKAVALNAPAFPAPAARLALIGYYVKQGDAASLKLARAESEKLKADKNDAAFSAKAEEKLKGAGSAG
jgi:hypothetical protein